MNLPLPIQDILKAGTVNRWNIVSTIRPQTLAEHLFNVSVIAGAISQEIGSVPVTTTVYFGIVHDIEEVILGDLPTPTKQRLREAGVNWGKIQDKVVPRSARVSDIDQVALVIKCADMMESLWFITTYGIGSHAEQVKERLDKDTWEFINKQHPKLIGACEKVWYDMVEGEIVI